MIFELAFAHKKPFDLRKLDEMSLMPTPSAGEYLGEHGGPGL